MRRVLLAVCAAARALAILHTAPTMLRINTDKENAKIANKSLEFVKVIKEDLRRNNDDYSAIELQERQRRLLPNTITKSSHIQPTGKLPVGKPPNHKVPQQELDEPAVDTRRTFNATDNRPPTPTNDTDKLKMFRSYTQKMRHLKKVRVDKLKRLIDKGKSRLFEMTRTSAMTVSGALVPLSAVPRGQARPHGAGPHGAGPHGARPQAAGPHRTGRHKGRPGQKWRPGKGPVKANEEDRARALRQLPPGGSPAPEQIDMAPARGVHIHMMRLKGRLCQRNMLNPEGPMYDSKGNTVMPAHAPELAHGRQFPETKKPQVVLPRCCNCCKKSVLGCQ